MPPTTPTNQQNLAVNAVKTAFNPTTTEQQAAFQNVQNAFTPTQPPVIDVSKPQQPFTVPQDTSGQPAQAASSLSDSFTPFIAQAQKQAEQAQAQLDPANQQMQALLSQLSPEAQLSQFQELSQQQLAPLQAGFGKSLQKLESIRSKYEAQKIREEQAGGGTATGALSAINQINVNQAREEAPVIATLQMQQGQISDAKDTIAQMFNIQRDALGTKLSFLQDFISKNEDKLSTAQRTKLDIALQQQQQKFTEESTKLDDQQEAALFLTGLSDRVDDNVMSEIQRDITNGIGFTDALAKYGQFEGVKTEEENLKLELLNEQIKGQRQDRINKADAQRFDELVARAELGDITALQGLGIEPKEPSEYVEMEREDAAELNTQINKNDLFKAVKVSTNVIDAITQLEDDLEMYSSQSTLNPSAKTTTLDSSYTSSLLQLKEFFNLGVLNGPDLTLMESAIPSPVLGIGKTAAKALPFVGENTFARQTQAGIDSQKKAMENKLDSDFLSLKASYADYNPADLPALQEADQAYILAKSKLNPGIRQMINENPDLYAEDIIQIINQRF